MGVQNKILNWRLQHTGLL